LIAAVTADKEIIHISLSIDLFCEADTFAQPPQFILKGGGMTLKRYSPTGYGIMEMSLGDGYYFAADVDAHLREMEKDHRAEVEKLIWNLAGCDTYAMGYDLDHDHDKTMALPALESVRKLALQERALRSELSALKEQREKKLRDFAKWVGFEEALTAFPKSKEKP